MHYLEVQRGDLLGARSPGHLLASENPRRGGTLADCAGLAVHFVGTVAGLLTAEIVPLHDPGETLALADAGDIHQLASVEHVDPDLLASLIGAHVVEAQLDQLAARSDTRLVQMATLRLSQPIGALGSVGDLKGRIAIGLRPFDLHNAAGLNPQHGNGHDAVVLVPYLGHSYFFADNRLGNHRDPAFTRTLRTGADPLGGTLRRSGLRLCRPVPGAG